MSLTDWNPEEIERWVQDFECSDIRPVSVVDADDYDKLLRLYKLLLSQLPNARDKPKPEYAGKIGHRPPNYKGNWR